MAPTSYPRIALVPIPPALAGMDYHAARQALRHIPGLRDACLAGLPGAERQAWACNHGSSIAHAERLLDSVIAVAAAVQSGSITPVTARRLLDDAIDAGTSRVLVSFQDGFDQLDDQLDTAPALERSVPPIQLDRLAIAVADHAQCRPGSPSPEVVGVLVDAIVIAGAILTQLGTTIPGLTALDRGDRVSALRRLQERWPSHVPQPARRLVAGSASRTAPGSETAWASVIGPLPLILAGGAALHTQPHRTVLRWAAWRRELEAELRCLLHAAASAA